jgi:hypothetical protein
MLTIVIFLLASSVAVFVVRKLFPRNRGSLPAQLSILTFALGIVLTMFASHRFNPTSLGGIAHATGVVGVLLIFIVGPIFILIALACFSRQSSLPR